MRTWSSFPIPVLAAALFFQAGPALAAPNEVASQFLVGAGIGGLLGFIAGFAIGKGIGKWLGKHHFD